MGKGELDYRPFIKYSSFVISPLCLHLSFSVKACARIVTHCSNNTTARVNVDIGVMAYVSTQSNRSFR